MKKWDIQKNIEAEENRALKKEELKEKLKTSKLLIHSSNLF